MLTTPAAPTANRSPHIHVVLDLHDAVQGLYAGVDAVRTSLLYTPDTPAGVYFVSATGTFEWTPGQDTFSTPVSYIVVNGGGSTAKTSATAVGGVTARVDWDGSVQPAGSVVNSADWLSDFLGTAPDLRSLAEQTGLVVKLNGGWTS